MNTDLSNTDGKNTRSAHVTSFALAMGLLALSACATKPAVLEGFKDRPSPVNFKVIDARPASDKTSERLSPWITSCTYEIHSIGDEQTVPSKLTILQRDLEDALGDKLKNAVMTVTQYRIFYNNRALMVGEVGKGYTGLVPDLMTHAGDRCSKEDTGGGWYEASEVTTQFSPFVVQIQATLDGKTYSARTVFSTRDSYVGMGGPSNYFFEVIHQANAALIEKLR